MCSYNIKRTLFDSLEERRGRIQKYKISRRGSRIDAQCAYLKCILFAAHFVIAPQVAQVTKTFNLEVP